jgi:pyrrolidone-carboxylate peptidase
MKLSALLLALAFMQACSHSPLSHASERAKVLFTTFDPFGGSSANNTQPIGALLKAHPEWLGAATDVAVCNLPVVYDEAPKAAMDCIRQENPSIVVSLGEADCALRVESAANNLDDVPGFPDNAGNVHVQREIIPGAPARLGFQFPVEAILCALDPEGKAGIDASISPGNFVCNNTAFTLTHALARSRTPFTFIHVPNSNCRADLKDPEKNAHLIAQGVAAALQALNSAPAESDRLWRPESREQRMPSSAAEVAALLSTLETGKAVGCELNYARRLQLAYQTAENRLKSKGGKGTDSGRKRKTTPPLAK